jgi:hypothetical protein
MVWEINGKGEGGKDTEGRRGLKYTITYYT